MTLTLLLMSFCYTTILHFAIMDRNEGFHNMIDRSGFA